VAFSLGKLRLKALFKYRSAVQRAPVTHHHVSNPYHAISIVLPAGATVSRGTVCPAAAACQGQRFLAAGAPQLPFPGCTVAHCGCRYQHYEDRRHAARRATDSGIPPTVPWQQRERRASQGRRITD
jgi:hypothetical protein